jgi:ribonuclease P protein component
MNMRQTIKKHPDFACAENDLTFKCPLFIARARPTKWDGDAKYGLIVTKRTFRHAVDRNRAKRLLRVWIRLNLAYMSPEMDYIFIARHDILNASLPDGSGLMKRAIKKLRAKN